MTMVREALSLSAYTAMLGNAIRMQPALRGAWVIAELSDVRRSGGHCYMELIEKDSSGVTRAKIRANIWQSNFIPLNRQFYEATGREISSGLKVLVRGSATHHNLYGLSFTIDDIDPSYTMGDMERLRREILERLRREGILDCNRQLPLPAAPQKIAVISASGAAGYGDFINQLSMNPAGVVLYPMLFSAVMQGERTSASVREALDKIEMTVDFWDCVVIIRGGGATTDLNGFDDYELARRIALFPLPVIVGIGHERDRTVLDEIACVRCKTPTAAAAFITDRLAEASQRVDALIASIMRYASENIKGENRRIDNLMARLPQTARLMMMETGRRLERMGTVLSLRTNARLSSETARIRALAGRLPLLASSAIERGKQRLVHAENMLRVLSPDNILKRGYSVTRINGRAVTSVSQVNPGDVLETTLHQGVLKSVAAGAVDEDRSGDDK